MIATVSPSALTGVLTAPASKSSMQRACAAALIKKGKTILHNPGVSADDKAALGIVQQLGGSVVAEGDVVIIDSRGILPVSDALYCGESGLSVRMFTSIAALSGKEISITGSGSLTRRPLDFFNEALPLLGVRVESHQGLLPLTIRGPLQPRDITIDGSLSSQFLTGLLFAYAAAGAKNVTITVTGLNSKPYVDLTLEVLTRFGLKVPVNKNYGEFYFDEGDAAGIEDDLHYMVEGDWSNAAFLLVAGAISGGIELKGLHGNSVQGDKEILTVLQQAGAHVSVNSSSVYIQPAPLTAFHFDATDCPDLFPPLVALAAYCTGTSSIKGVHRLTHKESNRSAALQTEFGKMNIKVEVDGDVMFVTGGAVVSGTVISSHNDHRIAMACAVAALSGRGQMVISEAQAVNKSYPDFWQQIQQVGAGITLTDK